MTAWRRGESFPGPEIDGAGTVVDVGCGPGPGCNLAGPLGAEVIGIEADHEPIPILEAGMRAMTVRSSRVPGGAAPR